MFTTLFRIKRTFQKLFRRLSFDYSRYSEVDVLRENWTEWSLDDWINRQPIEEQERLKKLQIEDYIALCDEHDMWKNKMFKKWEKAWKDRNYEPLTIEDFVDPKEFEGINWTKMEWFSHQTLEEQVRLKALSEYESDREFILWQIKKIAEKQKKEDELRKQGLLPPLKEPGPQYGNRPVSFTHYFNSGGQYVGYGASHGGITDYYNANGQYVGYDASTDGGNSNN